MSENKKQINWKKTLNLLKRGLKHLVLHNGLLKIIAVVISVFLWAGLISQDETLTRDKYFQNINVSITGTETMKSRGFIVVSDLDEILSNVNIIADVPQKQYQNADASAYNVRLDLSKINSTGEQEIKLLSSPSTVYGKVSAINPSTVKVQVEEYGTRSIVPVATPMDGDPPEGWSKPQTSVNPTVVSVSGPASLVTDITKAEARINLDDLEWKEGTVTDSFKLKLLTRSGEEVQSPLLSITSSSLVIDSVLIDMTILPCKQFYTKDLIRISGTPAPGYKVSEISTSPEIITVTAKQEVLDQMEELSLERTTVNVDNMKEDIPLQLTVFKPSQDAILSNETVTVNIVIVPEEP